MCEICEPSQGGSEVEVQKGSEPTSGHKFTDGSRPQRRRQGVRQEDTVAHFCPVAAKVF